VAARFRVAVVGAGAFGGWTALELLRRGATVQLIDAWGAGNVRASSGGETRVIRATYGTHVVYTEMAVRALDLWRRHDARWNAGLLHETGVLWMFGSDDEFGHASTEALRARGFAIEQLTRDDSQRKYPQIDFEGISSVYFEPDAGYLLARRACEHVFERVIAAGGRYDRAAVCEPVIVDSPRPSGIALIQGTPVEAEVFVFACGPWLGRLFPDAVGRLVTPTRQEVFYFGTPPGDARYHVPSLPVWLDATSGFVYGIPGDANRGFKIAYDTPGPVMDPTADDRTPSQDAVKAARTFLARRFPKLDGAPLIASEVCQYESTPDANFIIDRHPRASNIWIVGGGSGHGFKMGPVIGELVASLVLGDTTPDPLFSLERFAAPPPPGGWPPKWS
jgi:glycine/D-amino acid oxidase-like deaminating enzyme